MPLERRSLCTPSGQKPRARQEPARTGRGPSPARCGRQRGQLSSVTTKGVPVACPIGRSRPGNHGHSRTAAEANAVAPRQSAAALNRSRQGLTDRTCRPHGTPVSRARGVPDGTVISGKSRSLTDTPRRCAHLRWARSGGPVHNVCKQGVRGSDQKVSDHSPGNRRLRGRTRTSRNPLSC